jgi:hypothetical protein
MFNFVEEFLKVTRYIESPTSYLEWAAYTALAATMRDNVYIRIGAFRRIYPNIYVILLADSAATRKSSPLKALSKLVKQVNNTKIIEGRASIQAVLEDLAAVKNIKGKTISGASCLLYSEEFASLFVKDPQVSGVVTDLYDYHDEWPVRLKSGTINLKEVCVTICAASNTAFLSEMFHKVDILGGLVGRTVFIIEEKARFKDLGFDDPTTDVDLEPLVRHLIALSRKQGVVQLTEAALAYLKEWYDTTDFAKNESKTGFEHRAHTLATKLAICLAASEEEWNLVLEERHIKTAINKLLPLWSNYKRISAMINISQQPVNQAISDIMVILIKINKPFERELLLTSLLGRIDGETLDKAIITLEQSGLVKVGGNQAKVTYEITGKARAMFLKEFETKGVVN